MNGKFPDLTQDTGVIPSSQLLEQEMKDISSEGETKFSGSSAHADGFPLYLENADSNWTEQTLGIQLVELRTDELFPTDDQPRQSFDEEALAELAASIRTYGVLQPLIVTQESPSTYRIVAGERRWRAAKAVGLEILPCVLRDPGEHSNLEIALIENIQREELSPIDEAAGYRRLIEDYNYSQEILASKIGKDRSTIANSLRLLSLPAEILKDLRDKLISAGHARALCSLDDRKLQLRAHTIVITRKLSVRQTEELVKALKKDKQEPKPLKDNLTPDLRHLCDQFKGHLGTKVKISGDPERGKIEISYYTSDDLERIADLVLGNPLMPPFQ